MDLKKNRDCMVNVQRPGSRSGNTGNAPLLLLTATSYFPFKAFLKPRMAFLSHYNSVTSSILLFLFHNDLLCLLPLISQTRTPTYYLWKFPHARPSVWLSTHV